MSYLISGLNFTGIYEYSSDREYQKYDIVDYQLNDSISVFPDYDADNNLAFWFNNDYIKDFDVDASTLISRWRLRGQFVSSAGLEDSLRYLKQDDETKRPVINLNSNFTILQGDEYLEGDFGEYNNRTFFLCFEALPFSQNSFDEQTIFSVSDTQDFSSNVGSIKVKGNDQYISPSASAFFVVDGSDYNAKTVLYNNPTILTITQAYDSDTQVKSMVVRQNGLQVANLNSFDDGWLGQYLKIGDNPNNQGIKYYDFFCYDSVLSESEIKSYEKYLFETYFNTQGLFFAKTNVPVGADYGPLTPIGDYQYWTRELGDLFHLSYGCEATFSTKLSNAKLGDGYASNIVRNVNPLNSQFNLKYDGLTDLQAKALITFFENAPEKYNSNLNESFSGVNIDLFPPYKKNAEVFFLDIKHETPYNNINNISILAESLYDSSLDYKGILVELDEVNIRTYSDELSSFSYNDIFYCDDSSVNLRGYYFYTGINTNTVLNEENGPLGNNSYFTKDFYFKPDIDYNLDSKTRLITVDHEGSTKQYIKDGINYNKLEFDVVFSNRSDKEARAILKFLDSKAGFKLFDYTLPQPYNKTIKVFCPEWSHNQVFLNNNQITAKFIQFIGSVKRVGAFNTKIHFDEAPTYKISLATTTVIYGKLYADNSYFSSEFIHIIRNGKKALLGLLSELFGVDVEDWTDLN